jgi:hypothetical protein
MAGGSLTEIRVYSINMQNRAREKVQQHCNGLRVCCKFEMIVNFLDGMPKKLYSRGRK